MQSLKDFFTNRRFQYGAVAITFTVVFLALVLTGSFVVDYLTDRFSLKIDLTPSGIFDLADETTELVGGMQQRVMVYALATEAQYGNNRETALILDVMRRIIAASGGNMSLQFIDPMANPGFVNRFTQDPVAGFSMILEGENGRHRIIPWGAMATTLADGSGMVVLESNVVSGLLFINSPVIPRIGFIQGHGERNLDVFRWYLEASNCEVVDVNLVMDAIPDDIDVLVLASPRADYSPESIRHLDAWLAQPGRQSLMVFMDAGFPHFEVLERYFLEWGFSFEPAVILDARRSISGFPTAIMPDVQPHAITEDLRRDWNLALPETRPVNLHYVSGRETHTLLTSSGAAFAKRLDQGTIVNREQEPDDAIGPFVVGGMTERWSMQANVITDSRVYFFGTSVITDFIADGRFLNSQFFDAILDHLFPEKQTISVRPKILTAYRFAPTSGQVTMVRIALVAVLPLVILGFGLLITWRRRHS
jgi:ABC-type uncharacterized transport system involved in gliding motility auxiliary subunit